MTPATPDPRSPSPADDTPEPSAAKPGLVNRTVYQELRRIAAQRMAAQPAGHTLQPTVLVHEAWIRLSQRDRSWRDQSHFIASAALTMRRILIDHARRKATFRHALGDTRDEADALAAPTPTDNLLLLDEAIQELEKVHPVHAQIVIARFFAGLTCREIADELQLSERSVERFWAFAKVWLLRWFRAER